MIANVSAGHGAAAVIVTPNESPTPLGGCGTWTTSPSTAATVNEKRSIVTRMVVPGGSHASFSATVSFVVSTRVVVASSSIELVPLSTVTVAGGANPAGPVYAIGHPAGIVVSAAQVAAHGSVWKSPW